MTGSGPVLTDDFDLLKVLSDKIAVGDGCWRWTASLMNTGYGQVSVHLPEGRRHTMRLAHRIVYELMVGPIPEGLQLDHLCRNRWCVRPDHLEPVTARENMRRGHFGMKTHCPQGHPYSGDNLILHKKPPGRSPGRECRACCQARDRDRRRQ